MRSHSARQSLLCLCGLMANLIFATIAFAQKDGIPKCAGLPADGLRIATGPDGGSYQLVGKLLREFAPDLDIRPCKTQGTLENLRLLSQGDVELGIGQGDVVHKGWSHEAPPESHKQGNKAANDWSTIHFKDIKLVRWLYSEKLQIVAAPHTYISSLSDLRKKRLWLGHSEGGTYDTAHEVLRAAGFSEGDYELREDILTLQAANEDLLTGKLDAIFRSTSVPMDYVSEPYSEKPVTITDLFRGHSEVYLVGLDRPVVDRLLQSPSYVESPVYRGSYPQQRNGVLTIGIEAMLLTQTVASAKNPHAIAEINDLLVRQRAKLQKALNIELDLLDKKIDPDMDTAEMSIADHVDPAVINSLRPTKFSQYGGPAALLVGFALLLLYISRSKNVLETLGGRSKYIISTLILIVSCGIFGLALWGYEHRYSFDFQNPWIAAESLMIYFARGLKTESLMTPKGQVTALLALAIIASLVHWMHSEALNDTVISWSKWLSRILYGRASALRPDERHSVILNWNARAARQVTAWAAAKKAARGDIRVVTSEPVVLPAHISANAVHLVSGDPKTRAALDEARVSDAECVLICSAWCKLDPSDRRKVVDSELADSYTIRAIQTIRALNGSSKRVVPILAEIRLERNRHEAETAGAPRIDILAPEAADAAAANGHTWPALASPSAAATEAAH
jgi:TRAP transporter TAXI family solute receptor